jgi:hypothetical protein
MKGISHPSGTQRDVARSWLQARGFHAEENIESLAELFCVRESTAKLDGWNTGRALGAWEVENKRPLERPVTDSYELGAANMLAEACRFMHELAETTPGPEAAIFAMLERAKLIGDLLRKDFSL